MRTWHSAVPLVVVSLVLVLVLPVPVPVLVLVLQEWDHEQQLEEQQLEVAHLLEQRVSVRKT